ncbi:glutathione transferase [Ranunculus cassubicifolius]
MQLSKKHENHQIDPCFYIFQLNKQKFPQVTRSHIHIAEFLSRLFIRWNTGLQKEIKLVPLDLQNRPAWYKEEVYPLNKVPALEHKNKIIGESLDLIKYLDSNFDGPSLYPKDAAKKEFVDELLNHTDTFTENAAKAFKGEPGTDIGSPFDYLENKLSKYGDGPFFLGSEFSLADIAYAPFVEGYQLFLENVKNYHLEAGRPKLAAWIEAMNKKEAYTQTKHDPKALLEMYKRKFATPGAGIPITMFC